MKGKTMTIKQKNDEDGEETMTMGGTISEKN